MSATANIRAGRAYVEVTAETKDVLAKALEDPELTRRVEESMRSSASSPESSV